MQILSMRISYWVEFKESGVYFKTLKEANAFLINNEDAKSISKHTITNDAFERAYNADGGFIEKEELIKVKTLFK